MSAPQQITSLKKPPEGWQPPARGEWGAAHPAYNNRHTSAVTPVDAEPTAELPTFTPGLHALPEQCLHCGSRFVNREEALGTHQRGLLTCGRCSRQLCWLAPALASRLMPTSSAPTAAAAPARQQVDRPKVRREIECTDGCGPACSVAFGHDAKTHEAYGHDLAQRAVQHTAPSAIVRTGALAIDAATCEARVNGAPVDLTATEFRVLLTLALRIGAVVAHDEMAREVWGHLAREGNLAHMVRVNVARMRTALGSAADLIETRPGFGYLLRKEPPVDDASRARLQQPRLHHRLALRPGRAGGLVVARSRPRGVRRGTGIQRPPFRAGLEETAMSTTNGTATIETPTSVTVFVADTVAESAHLEATAPIAVQLPAAPSSALDQALGWFADVARMRDALAAEERELVAHLERVRSTREQLSQVVAIFDGTAPQPAAPSSPVASVRPGSRGLPEGRWSRAHAACVVCGRADRPHKSHGRCEPCDAAARKLANKEQSPS